MDEIVVPEGAKAYATREMWTSETIGRRLPIAEAWVSHLIRELGKLGALGVAKWLQEFPPTPSEQQVEELICDLNLLTSAPLAIHGPRFTAEWMRRMFIVDNFDPTLGGKLSGRTFTQKEADRIKNYIQMQVRPDAR
jgi:hypothetical protein